MPHGKVYAFDEHKCKVEVNPKADSITTEQGVHGLRYYEKKLQANVDGEWINVGGAGLTITASVETGSVVTAKRDNSDGKGADEVTATSVDGKAVLELPMAGTYSVYAELNRIRSETVQVVCSGNYPASIRYIRLTVIVDAGSEITISDGKTTLNGTSTGSDMFYLPNTGTWTVKAELDGQETSDSISISEYKDYTLELSYISSVLNNNTWETISKLSSEGTASSIWSVGDTKEITINGTVGNRTFENLNINVFIIGFDHNASIEGNNKIHFLLGKIDNKFVALVDSDYDDYTSSDGAFTMNPTYMSSYGNSEGGWESSHMRKTILGSDKEPTSQSGNTLIAALPSELRAVMKSVTKYTDNVKGGQNKAESVTSTTDYLWLLSEFEVYGTATTANSTEQNYQEQYAYFTSGNEYTVWAYKHSYTETVCSWWLRSPDRSNSSYFCYVFKTHSGVGSYYSNRSFGIVAAFAV